MAACHSPRSAAPATPFNREVQDLFLAFHETSNADKITESDGDYNVLLFVKLFEGNVLCGKVSVPCKKYAKRIEQTWNACSIRMLSPRIDFF